MRLTRRNLCLRPDRQLLFFLLTGEDRTDELSALSYQAVDCVRRSGSGAVCRVDSRLRRRHRLAAPVAATARGVNATHSTSLVIPPAISHSTKIAPNTKRAPVIFPVGCGATLALFGKHTALATEGVGGIVPTAGTEGGFFPEAVEVVLTRQSCITADFGGGGAGGVCFGGTATFVGGNTGGGCDTTRVPTGTLAIVFGGAGCTTIFPGACGTIGGAPCTGPGGGAAALCAGACGTATIVPGLRSISDCGGAASKSVRKASIYFPLPLPTRPVYADTGTFLKSSARETFPA